MAAALTRKQISDAVDPLGWRLILAVAVTHVRAPSLSAAAEAAAVAVAAAGTAGDGHLSADVRADRVVLRLQTAAAGLVTDEDLRLARTVTDALAARSLHTGPGDDVLAPQTFEVAIDALDIPAVRPFWQAVTGYVDRPGPPDPGGELVDPLGSGPTLWFQQMDAPRPQRNRIHLDVEVAPERARSRIDAALAAGGTLLSAAAAPAFWVLADSEGNEVCVCTWQGRD
jgi:4a-hydroxytetrahydrobiopterin dehydratase